MNKGQENIKWPKMLLCFKHQIVCGVKIQFAHSFAPNKS